MNKPILNGSTKSNSNNISSNNTFNSNYEFKNNSQYILQDFNLKVREGESLAIVG